MAAPTIELRKRVTLVFILRFMPFGGLNPLPSPQHQRRKGSWQMVLCKALWRDHGLKLWMKIAVIKSRGRQSQTPCGPVNRKYFVFTILLVLFYKTLIQTIHCSFDYYVIAALINRTATVGDHYNPKLFF
jgi:hypothetical protein